MINATCKVCRRCPSLRSFSFLRTSQDIADDLLVFNPPKLPTTQMILFAEFLYATLFLKLSLQTTNNSTKELIIVKGFGLLCLNFLLQEVILLYYETILQMQILFLLLF